jgi:hypothetical protein
VSRLIDDVIEDAVQASDDAIRSGAVPPLKPFLFVQKGLQINNSWGAYAYFYAQAFEQMAEIALKDRHAKHSGPLLSLARHSIELALKEAVYEFEEATGCAAGNFRHDLKKMWKALLDQMRLASLPRDCEWTKHCEQLVDYIASFDPKGDRFRDPADIGGRDREYIDVDVEGLVKAHWDLTAYCDGVTECLRTRREI